MYYYGLRALVDGAQELSRLEGDELCEGFWALLV
jgi:hypothetical protein